MAYVPAPEGAYILASPLDERSKNELDGNSKIIHVIRHGEAAHNCTFGSFTPNDQLTDCEQYCITKSQFDVTVQMDVFSRTLNCLTQV